MNTHYAVIHKALADAVARKGIPNNPADLAPKPPKPRADMQTYIRVKPERLFEATKDDRLHAPWVFLAGTGARKGEALGLRWTDVDLDARLVTIQRQARRAKGKGILHAETKAYGSVRT